MKLQFWFEFASTYSYPAAMRVQAAAQRAGVDVEWRAFLLGPIFRQQGWNDSPFNIYAQKGHYMWRDLERACSSLALPLNRPSVFPRNGLQAARIACLHAEAPWLPEFVRRIYQANFVDDQDISSPALLGSCLQALVPDPAAVLAAIQEPEVKAKLLAQSEQALVRGIFGAPFFFAGDEPFWGNDRLDEAIAWCVKHRTG